MSTRRRRSNRIQSSQTIAHGRITTPRRAFRCEPHMSAASANATGTLFAFSTLTNAHTHKHTNRHIRTGRTERQRTPEDDHREWSYIHTSLSIEAYIFGIRIHLIRIRLHRIRTLTYTHAQTLSVRPNGRIFRVAPDSRHSGAFSRMTTLCVLCDMPRRDGQLCAPTQRVRARYASRITSNQLLVTLWAFRGSVCNGDE